MKPTLTIQRRQTRSAYGADLRRLFSLTIEVGDKEWGAFDYHGAGAGGSSSLTSFLIQLRVSIGSIACGSGGKLLVAFQRARLSLSIVVSVKGASVWSDSSLSNIFVLNFG